MNKRVKALILAGIMTISMVGCGKQSGDKKETEETKVTLILDEGGVNDQSFNQSAWEGALKAEKELGVEVSYIESNQEADYMQNVETAIDNDSDLIIGVGFKLTETIGEAAQDYPEQKFAIIDGNYEEIPSNVQPILFNEEESGYLVGLVAAKMTETKKVGFVGGMDIPSVTNFFIGFEKAIKEVDPTIEVSKQYINSFTDAAKGKAISNQMIKEGVDIVFTAAGGGNNGVFESTKEQNKYVIGVDMPSSYIAPDVVITSALKNVGTGVELTIKDLIEENFKGGEVKMFDLSNGGVGYEDTKLLPQEVKDFVKSKVK